MVLRFKELKMDAQYLNLNYFYRNVKTVVTEK
jgi:hypothetical protein